MLFNSFEFAVFFISVLILYSILNHKWQNRMLLVASYIFYGWWDWRFLSLLWISTTLDYVCGIKIHESADVGRRKLFLWLSVCGNLGILGFFKYYNFFTANMETLLGSLGVSIQPVYLNIILPLGISFYTFQTMSYTIDIYRREMVPTRKFFDFALFVAFFPQLIAGPIERAKHLLPQILLPRKISANKVEEGCFLIFWGLFQKMFVADNLARIVDTVFMPKPSYNGVLVLLGVYAFAFQIFCDFAGYSNIARGLGKVMGFDIVANFNFPFFSVNMQDLWRRWHISLSSWVKDYLYIPLKKNKKIPIGISLMITMVAVGLWHGAAWHFIAVGVYCGVLLIAHGIIRNKFKHLIQPKTRLGQLTWRITRIVFLSLVLSVVGILFRAQSISQVFNMLEGLFFNFTFPQTGVKSIFLDMLYYIWFFMLVHTIQFVKDDLTFILKSNLVVKASFYAACCYFFAKGGFYNAEAFIYFVF